MKILPLLFFVLSLVTATLLGQGGAESPREVQPDAAGADIAAKKVQAAQQRLKKTGEDKYEIGEIKFNSRTHEISFPAKLNMTEGVLEYALVHEHGKTHESLLSTTVSPIEVNLAMLLCHYEAHLGEALKNRKDLMATTKALVEKPMDNPGANQIHVTLLWKDKDGKEQRAAIADWIHDRNSGRALVVDHWTYTGSVINEVGFAAEFDGSVIGIYFDMVAMINCPVEGNQSDEIWQVETKDVPPLETPVTVIISKVNAKPTSDENKSSN